MVRNARRWLRDTLRIRVLCFMRRGKASAARERKGQGSSSVESPRTFSILGGGLSLRMSKARLV